MLFDQAVAGIPFKLIGGYGWRPQGTPHAVAIASRLEPESVQQFFDTAYLGFSVPWLPAIPPGDDVVDDLSDVPRALRRRHRRHPPVGKHPDAVPAAGDRGVGEPVAPGRGDRLVRRPGAPPSLRGLKSRPVRPGTVHGGYQAVATCLIRVQSPRPSRERSLPLPEARSVSPGTVPGGGGGRARPSARAGYRPLRPTAAFHRLNGQSIDRPGRRTIGDHMSTDTAPAQTQSERLDALIEDQERRFVERQPTSAGLRARAMSSLAGGVTSIVADHHAPGRVAQPRRGVEDLRRRRRRVRRPPRRLRRRTGRARPPGHGRRGHPPGRQRHPLRPADRGRHRGGRGARPAASGCRSVAVQQLGHRGHHGRHPSHALDHRPGPDHQGGGLLPRPPRLGAGVRRPRARRGRAGRRARTACRRRSGHPDRRSPTSPSSSATTTSPPSSGSSRPTPVRWPA